jgi:hypothetical protein
MLFPYSGLNCASSEIGLVIEVTRKVVMGPEIRGQRKQSDLNQ